MLAKDIEFKVGMEFTIYQKSSYGTEYDKIKNVVVTKIRNYKSRGQKVHIKDLYIGINSSIWKEEYKHQIELKEEKPASTPIYVENNTGIIQ